MAAATTLAFSPDVRQKMFARDQGECQECGKRFRDGWLLDCAHFDHDHASSNYNSVDNGRVLCLEDHLKDHLEAGDTDAVRLIQRRIQESGGGRTREWLAAHRNRK